jgi:hypothetical protein
VNETGPWEAGSLVTTKGHLNFCKKLGISPTRADGLSRFEALQAEDGSVGAGAYRSQIMRCKTVGQWKVKLKVLIPDEDGIADISALPDLPSIFNYIWEQLWAEIDFNEV